MSVDMFSHMMQPQTAMAVGLATHYFDVLQGLFNSVDTNGDGYIDKREFAQMLNRSATHKRTESELDKIMKEIDLDGNDMIDFYEFVAYVSKLDGYDRPKDELEIHQAFKYFDRDGSGAIDRNEVQLLLRMVGLKCRAQDIERFMVRYDLNGDGVISYQEFRKFYKEIVSNDKF
jgi:Ca2+-binding EF-hand superfamily protein